MNFFICLCETVIQADPFLKIIIIDNPDNQIICIVFFLNDVITTEIYAYYSKCNDLLISLEHPDLENAGRRREIQVSKMCMYLLT